MDILRLSCDRSGNVQFSMNIFSILIILVLAFVIRWSIQKYREKGFGQLKKEAQMFGMEIRGQGRHHYSRKERETAYQIWFDMESNQIGTVELGDNVEWSKIHNSWEGFLQSIQNVIKNQPVKTFKRSQSENNLVNQCVMFLNQDLKPYLDKWKEPCSSFLEQERQQLSEGEVVGTLDLQKRFKDYGVLKEDMRKTNGRIGEFKKLLYSAAFKK